MGRPHTRPDTFHENRRRIQYRESKARRKAWKLGFFDWLRLIYAPPRVCFESWYEGQSPGPGWRREAIIEAAHNHNLLILVEEADADE